jgi:hypothetical protein
VDEFTFPFVGRIDILKLALREFWLEAGVRSFMNAAQERASFVVAPPALRLTPFRHHSGGEWEMRVNHQISIFNINNSIFMPGT